MQAAWALTAAFANFEAAHSSSYMILQEHGNDLLLIRQTDHAVLSGFFARQWGNDLFQRPEPFASFLMAVTEHDNGWLEWEMAPQLDPKTHLPYSFMSLPTEQHISLYERGIERVVKSDRYAGLLVSMHCQELYDRTRATIPGFSSKYVRASEAELVNSFVQSLKLQQLRLKVDLRADPVMNQYAEEKGIDTNFRLLEILDRLSLYFCMDPMQPTSIENVPVDARGSEFDLELRPEPNNVVSMTPYPFRKNPLQVSILTRRVPKRFYTDNGQFQRTLAQAPYAAINFVLRAGNALSASRFAVA